MVFDRRFTADSPRYFRSASNADKQSDGLRPPLQDYYVLLTRSFLMVLDSARQDFRLKSVAQLVALDIEIIPGLEIEPETVRRAEIARKPKSGVGSHRASSVDDLIDAARRDTDVLGQPVLADAHRLEEFL